ncbi:hypothetical protein TrLO_g6840 [Triparma laevis f. longispina]|uniref:Glutaredoxin domain-containing protein n=1 Tax=Triparma laevis f. longispina TaxID=1714387 RepID=A0A9W7FC77_9STRA|nr:hypothetical protein TrLO_g6840 [Triparma laevis f. longispina]
MNSLISEWLSKEENTPEGNAGDTEWSNPKLTASEQEKILKIRQAAADDTLMNDDPEAWSKVIRKSMKGGDDFDGSSSDLLESSIDSDAVRTATLKRASGDWDSEVKSQHNSQHVEMEMYMMEGCPSCDSMKKVLDSKGLIYKMINVKEDPELNEEQQRRFRHAQWNTVPQLYLIRSPPYNGRDSETLVGGYDNMEEKMRTPLWEYWIGE